MLFVHWAAANKAAHLHLVDIQVPASLPETLVGPGSGLGAVTITCSDIGRTDDAAQAIMSCGGAPHSGIIHAAGLLQVRAPPPSDTVISVMKCKFPGPGSFLL